MRCLYHKRACTDIAVSIGLLFCDEFQGIRYIMYKILVQPFAEADTGDIPCILVTDTPLKVKKYPRCGMELCGEKRSEKLGFHCSTVWRIAKTNIR